MFLRTCVHISGRTFATCKKQAIPTPLSYLKQFYLKVHPDLIDPKFVSHNASIAQVNADSLAKLNAIVDYAHEIQEGGIEREKQQFYDHPPEHTLSFYYDIKTNLRDAQRLKISKKIIKLKFNIPFEKPRTIEVLHYINWYLCQLLFRSGVEIPKDTRSQWIDEFSLKKLKRKKHSIHLLSNDAWIAEYRKFQLFHDSHITNFPEDDLFKEDVVKIEPTDSIGDILVPSLLHAGLIRFACQLVRSKQIRALSELKKLFNNYYTEINYKQWIGSGIYFVAPTFRAKWINEKELKTTSYLYNKGYAPPHKGFFTIPWDYDIHDFMLYTNIYSSK